MKRSTHNLIQGSHEWAEYRRNHFNASDASSMLGISSYKSRNELLKEMATGLQKEVPTSIQKIFDDGHRFESQMRPIAEKIIGDDLYSPVMSLLVNGLRLSASFDGLTLLGDVAWEHKTLNQKLKKSLTVGQIPDEYKPQLEQQLLVSGAEKCLFMASNGTEEEALHAWYKSDPNLKQALIDGWAQFEKDLAGFEVKAAPELIEATVIPTLPALRISVTGMVNNSNLDAYKAEAIRIIESVNTRLVTDQDFADAEETVKFFKNGEAELAAGKKAILAQTASIDDVFRTIDEISENMRQKRLFLDKLVKQQKEAIKLGIIKSANEAMHAYWYSEARDYPLAGTCKILPDVAGAIKGLRTISSIENAANTALANAKIEAGKLISRIKINSAVFEKEAANLRFLFNDLSSLIYKEDGDFKSIVLIRIAEHEAEQERRMEAERERIAAQERAKIQAENERQQERQADSEKINAYLEEARQAGSFKKPETPVKRLAQSLETAIDDWASDAKISKKKLSDLKAILIHHLEVKPVKAA